MNNEQVELVVSIAILAIVVSFAGVAFKAGIESHRVTMANAEIMQKLRAITDQLNADFKGLIERPSGQVFFQVGPHPYNGPLRGDRIAFFANGDFQSIGQYEYGSSGARKTVAGNVAAIFYGQAGDPDPDVPPNRTPFRGDPTKKILARRQIILTSDIDLTDPNALEYAEYDKTSLSVLRAGDPNYLGELVETAPLIDPQLESNLVMYMAEGVDDFTIQLGVIDASDSVTWWPGEDPRAVRKVLLEGPNPVLIEDVDARAVKFTFTLYDSRGIIRNGKTFTHIVYVGD